MDCRGVKRIENDRYCRDNRRKKSVQDQDQYRCGRVGIQKGGGEGAWKTEKEGAPLIEGARERSREEGRRETHVADDSELT